MKTILKQFSVVACLLCVGLSVSACGEKNEITGIDVTISNKAILRGQNLTGLSVKGNLEDGSTTMIDAENFTISEFDKNAIGRQKITVTYKEMAKTVDIVVADKIINNDQELSNAILQQGNGEAWAIQSGTYNLMQDKPFQGPEVMENWYMPIHKSIKIYGIDTPKLLSNSQSANQGLGSQNFITVFANDVEIDGVNLESKQVVNKVVEVIGNNFKMSNIKITPPKDPITNEDVKFAGTIYFSHKDNKDQSVKHTASLENIEMKYGRISFSGANETSEVSLKNIKIDFAGADYIDLNPEDQIDSVDEISYMGYSNTSNAKVSAENCQLTISQSFKESDSYAKLLAEMPETGLTLVDALTVK